jgi:hypothetical protein
VWEVHGGEAGLVPDPEMQQTPEICMRNSRFTLCLMFFPYRFDSYRYLFFDLIEKSEISGSERITAILSFFGRLIRLESDPAVDDVILDA